MKKNLFHYKDYKAYLSDKIEEMPNKGRGERSKIAEVLRCHIAYISQVLNGNAQLSIEQADVLNHYLSHTSEEADFFLLLVQAARAGTKSLEDYYKKKIAEIIQKRELLKNRLEYEKELAVTVQPIYYSAWYYSAVHFLCAIPDFQKKEAIAEHLGLSLQLVGKVLEFLLAAGLVVQKGDRFELGTVRIHLGSDSPMISKHHTNWRMQALQSLERAESTDLHYSSVIALEESLVPYVREALVKAIEEVRKVMKPTSKYEALYCYSLDLFEIGKRKEHKKNKERFEKRSKYVENTLDN